MCEESKEAGIRTLVMLDEQGEQLDRIEEGLDQINQDMRDAEKNLEGMEKCCGLCVLPWKKGKSFEKSGDYANTWKKDDDGPTNTNGPRMVVGDQNGMGGPSSGYVTRITGDAREEEMETNIKEDKKSRINEMKYSFNRAQMLFRLNFIVSIKGNCYSHGLFFYLTLPASKTERKFGNRGTAYGRKNSKTLTKDAFPALLTQLHVVLFPDRVTHGKNLESGFLECGVHPFHQDKVLDQLSDHEVVKEDDEVISVRVLDVVLGMLKSMRGVDESKPKKRQKKLTVTPGKIISTEDVSASGSEMIAISSSREKHGERE
ncbi:synaptosomal-associated protein 25-like isoform X6 [Octopus vulgaris]|uniref:Synaptosomal-associated protein n=1 Tax=Octopus vulgaris TaxID=6645 RepID=A0AA36BF45_OCTVU|nr:synaptosomal-associated protein 25-like isoform X6 [Octopus vulgaris]